MDVELAVDVHEMRLGGALGDVQLALDERQAAPPRQQQRHFVFAGGEPVLVYEEAERIGILSPPSAFSAPSPRSAPRSATAACPEAQAVSEPSAQSASF